jgi:hypothetical protein
MRSSLFARSVFWCWFLALAVPGAGYAQGIYQTNGTEYPIVGTLPGDQVYPSLALLTNGGYLVWQDNRTDGDGLGISAQRLGGTLSGLLSPFPVNTIKAGDQERPQVTMLNNGGAAFVWQGGRVGAQHIYARFLSSSNTWISANDIQVNSTAGGDQIGAAVATLMNGNVVVVYSSLNQVATNSLEDVYGQILSPAGQKIGSEFLINQYTPFNQRTPAVAALQGGGFVVVWVSEIQRSGPVDNPNSGYLYAPTVRPSVDIYARLFGADGTAAGSEFVVNTGTDVCANPGVAPSSDGGFMVAWGQRNTQVRALSWDVFSRPFSASGGGGTVRTVNTYQYGDQYGPRITSLGTDYLVVWTSLGQDGDREGVYGQFLRSDGTPAGSEFRANTTTVSQQLHPTAASDGAGQFLIAWTSFVGGNGSFDLFAQRYLNSALPLPAMSPPWVYAPFTFNNNAYQPQLEVCWPFQVGLPITQYNVYVDGFPTPAATLTTNVWFLTGLAPSSTHSFQVDYVVVDGRHSPLSPPATGLTWQGYSWGGIPFEWMAAYYGGAGNVFNWPGPSMQLTPGGPTLLQVFLTGGIPTNTASWLRVNLVALPQGQYVTWNPQPGQVYQVQASTNLGSWANVGAPRFAAGTTDSMYVGSVSTTAYYRVLVLR